MIDSLTERQKQIPTSQLIKAEKQAKKSSPLCWCCLLGIIAMVLVGCEVKIPEFAGIYVLQNGKYKEVPRFKEFKRVEFNRRKRGDLGATDWNVKTVINKDQFIVVDQVAFAKNGFLVVQNKEWSDFKLLRVPHQGNLKDNEKGDEIVVRVDYGGSMMGMPLTLEGLQEKAEPAEVEIKQAKRGEDAFNYVPSKPPERGFYLVDYTINGRSHLGYNPILVQ